MSTATRVPETITISGDELSADDAVTTLRRYGRWKLVKNSFIRFRYADGFTNARALALQLCLSFIPLVIAAVGLSSALHQEKVGQIIIQTVAGVLPGKDSGDMVEQAAQRTHDQGVTGGQLALWLGLLAAIIALTTAMGQIERGVNRIYGIERDRPALRKYGRALLMAFTAGLLMQLGFLVIIAGDALGDSLAAAYGWGTHLRDVVADRLLAGRCRVGMDVLHRHHRARTASAAAGVLLVGVRIRSVACTLAASDRAARTLCREERVFRNDLRTVDRHLRPAAVGECILGRVVPRCRVRRAARSRPCGLAGAGISRSTDHRGTVRSSSDWS